MRFKPTVRPIPAKRHQLLGRDQTLDSLGAFRKEHANIATEQLAKLCKQRNRSLYESVLHHYAGFEKALKQPKPQPLTRLDLELAAVPADQLEEWLSSHGVGDFYEDEPEDD